MKPNAIVHLTAIAVVCAFSGSVASAQETRAAAASEARAAKAQGATTADEPGHSLFERGLSWANHRMDGQGGAKDGVYADFGELIPGSGWLSGGAGYRHHLFGDHAVVKASAAVSARRYVAAQSTVEWPRLLSDRLSLGAQVKYQDFTQISYFGIGADTPRSARTDYRLRNVDVAAAATAHPRRGLAIGGRAGYLRGRGVERGLSSIYPSTDDRFDEASAPGLSSVPRYGHADIFIEADRRDVPGYPTSGGVYRLGAASFRDLQGSGQSVRRLDMDAAQYVPVFHRNWVIALRSRVTLSQTPAGNVVPFYLLPTLGGESTLRGYSDYRFRDRNAALFSAEYRWPVFRMLDGALFVDGGTVAASPSDLWRTQLHRDYGFGLRLHSDTRSIARIDVARGTEGVRITASLHAPLGANHRSVAPFVP